MNSKEIPENLQKLSRRAYIAAECSGITKDQLQKLLSCFLSVGIAICPDWLVLSDVDCVPPGVASESDLHVNCMEALRAYGRKGGNDDEIF